MTKRQSRVMLFMMSMHERQKSSDRRRKAAAVLIQLIMAAMFAASAGAVTVGDLQVPFDLGKLKMAWKFKPDDNTVYRLPGYDDSSWQIISGFPHNWKDPGPGHSDTSIAWYRVRFTLTADAMRKPLMITVSPTIDANEVYLNGVLIGGTGALDPEGPMPKVPSGDRQGLHSVPPILVNPGGENVLALRIQSMFPNHAGLTFSHSTVVLGYERDLLIGYFLGNLPILFVVIILLGMGILFIAYYTTHPKSFDILFFGVSCISFGVYFFLRTQLKYFITDDYMLLKRAEFVVLFWMIYLFTDFIYFSFKRQDDPWKTFNRITAMLLNAVPAFSMFVPVITDSPVRWEQFFLQGFVFLWIFPFSFMFWLILREAARKNTDAYLMLAGLVFGILATVNDVLVQTRVLDWFRIGHLGFLGFVMVFAVITANRYLRMNRELSFLKNYLTNIIQSMPSALIAVDSHGTVRQWNQAATTFSGIETTDAIGRNLFSLYPVMEEFRNPLSAIIRVGSSRRIHRKAMPGENLRYFDITMFPLVQNGEVGVAIRLDDVTEVEKRERILMQAQKMEVLGTMAGGLAHDFNNILTAIAGTVSLFKIKTSRQELVPSDDLTECIQIVENSVARASDIVKQLLAIGKRTEQAFNRHDLNVTVRNVSKLCEKMFKNTVAIETSPSVDQAMIYADPSQLEQVLLNLCMNAYHAMTIMRIGGEDRGGTITIAVRKTPGGDIDGVIGHDKNGTYWKLSVTDTGVGIPQSEIGKIFDPFYTTKGAETGTGLGLAMVYSIVQQHRGFISVHSEIGTGTEMAVYFIADDRPELIETE